MEIFDRPWSSKVVLVKYGRCGEFPDPFLWSALLRARLADVSQIKALWRISGPLPSSRRARRVSARRGSNKGGVRNFGSKGSRLAPGSDIFSAPQSNKGVVWNFAGSARFLREFSQTPVK